MKIFECGSSHHPEDKSGESVSLRLKSDRRKSAADEIFIQSLKKVLDNRFVLLSDVYLEGLNEPLPLILIGPTGIWMIVTSEAKGVFKVLENSWEELNEKTGVWKIIKPNPMSEVVEKAAVLMGYLASKDFSLPPVDTVVFFSNPGAHAETNRPAARIVLIDALARFIATVLAEPVGLENDVIQNLVKEFYQEEDPLTAIGDIRDAYSLKEPPPPKPPREPTRLETISREEPKFVPRLLSMLPFTRRQWLLVGFLMIVNIIILLALVFVVVIST